MALKKSQLYRALDFSKNRADGDDISPGASPPATFTAATFYCLIAFQLLLTMR